MTKRISSSELAELVVGLLTNPQATGELCELQTFHRFFLDIGQVVADYCGGSVELCAETDTLLVTPNDSLSSLNNNVWCLFDSMGWGELDVEVQTLPIGEILTDSQRAAKREALTERLRPSDHGQVTDESVQLEEFDRNSLESLAKAVSPPNDFFELLDALDNVPDSELITFIRQHQGEG